MMCQRIGRSPIVIIGFGTREDVSPIRIPSPPQNSTTFIARFLLRSLIRPAKHLGVRNGDDQLSSPCPYVRELRRDFLLQIPWQDEDVVGTGLLDPLRGIDRNVRSGEEPAVLVWVPVDRVVEQVGADAAVVEKRVALSGCAVADYLLSLATKPDQELEQAPLRLGDARAELAVTVDRVVPACALLVEDALDALAALVHRALPLDEDAERATVRGKLLDVEDLESVLGEEANHRRQREVRVVLVVDGVELEPLDQSHEMGHLDRRHAVRRKHDLDS